MRRILLGIALGWFTTAACVFAQGPPDRPSSPYSPTVAVPSAAGDILTRPVADGGSATAPAQIPPARAITDGMAGPGACPQTQCGSCCRCTPEGRFWFSAEYLLWWTSGTTVPPLVTGSPPGTARTEAGVLGAPGTVVLFGNGPVNSYVQSGARLRGVFWFDECNTCGLDGGFFFLAPQTRSHTFECDPVNFAAVGRPFFNVGTGLQDAELVCLPNVVDGSVTVRTDHDLYGAEANFRHNLYCCSDCDHRCRLDGLIGYRFLSMNEGVLIDENLTAIDPQGRIPIGTTFVVNDTFRTYNRFHGVQVGLAGDCRWGRIVAEARAMVGIGPTIQYATIAGSTATTIPGQTTVQNTGGLLALGTNIGSYQQTKFSVVPEINLNLGYLLTEHLRVFVGYSFLYWSNVARPGNLIDTNVNTSQLPPGTLTGTPAPVFRFRTTDFWTQGISFGAQLRF